MNSEQIAVLGAGQMGGGIAHVCALAGRVTHLYDNHPPALAGAMAAIEKNLARQVKKGVVKKTQAAAALKKIQPHETLGSWLNSADFIIEAVVENRDIKHEVYQAAAEFTATAAVFASNTSSYSITELAAHSPRPENFIGMHFMNPAPLMPLVEIIVGAQSSEKTAQNTERLAVALGKQPVRANDYPGFITNRILMPMINEAIYALFENIGDTNAIDTAMRLGMNHPMGPLTLADFIGLDTCLAIMNVMFNGYGDSKFRPCPLLKKMVAAGYLGKKSGIGFYDYSSAHPIATNFHHCP